MVYYQTTTPPTISAPPPPPHRSSVPTVFPNGVPQPLYDNISPLPQTSHAVGHPATGVVSTQGLPGEAPGLMFCLHCRTTVVTIVNRVPGGLQWLFCFISSALCLFCFAWIPFFIDAWKDVEHSCSRCGQVLHIYRQMRRENEPKRNCTPWC
ncbi:cell death-inducing p53-target protein 1 homolog [Synchiropus splendidus]|uniref:cell death-inducing p53-target protein 1 homolog n=1 Tax=Synchiropus splendidus TaxID=270530 RepID=UPI00237E9503|nr:cell death-inducing p53-target protein 1 homolog [Synchiropus splendidus]